MVCCRSVCVRACVCRYALRYTVARRGESAKLVRAQDEANAEKPVALPTREGAVF